MKKYCLSVNFLGILLIFFNISLIICRLCGVDQFNIEPYPLDIKTQVSSLESSSSTTNSKTYGPIKIGFDFTSFEKPLLMTSEVYSNIKSLLKETAKEFKKFLKIIHQNYDISSFYTNIINNCKVNTISSQYSYFLIDNDLIIFPMFSDQLSDGTLAAAGPCLTISNRPIAGYLYINSKINFALLNTNLYLKNILFHEITHVLLFNPNLLKKLGIMKEENSINYIISPKAINQIRKHFDCSSITQFPLETQGGSGTAGNHWDSRYMLGAYMVGSQYQEQAISDITLALFEDTGYYQVNYYSGGLLKFGKGKGCNFINKKCIENEKPISNEFCVVPDELKCTSARTMKGNCLIAHYERIPEEYQYF